MHEQSDVGLVDDEREWGAARLQFNSNSVVC